MPVKGPRPGPSPLRKHPVLPPHVGCGWGCPRPTAAGGELEKLGRALRGVTGVRRGLLRCPPFPQPVSYVEQGCWGWMRELGHVQGAEQGLGHGEGGNTL